MGWVDIMISRPLFILFAARSPVALGRRDHSMMMSYDHHSRRPTTAFLFNPPMTIDRSLFVLHSSSGKTSLTRFVGYATHCTWEEAQTILDSVKTDHPKSRHVCFGYMSGDTERSSDDGEPSGTAGAPILNAIKGENLQTHYA
jgi:hypothetical protein